ncbi:hypothetical protein E1B28_001076 [Marasmius oreades]|uniref:Transmembrane protein 135 n=1 Tax=Marasmius oreades TaxID=181124 RepID=A0A9P8AF20_9AGAR|nr:uncharacterized protein E1B28_001076 [Marasmius oreades]KAG7099209.1 hypothetical protein E1B28_001076 [Marasmius oreades]
MSSPKFKPWSETLKLNLANIQFPDDPTHSTQVALRTYLLTLSLSLGPSLIPVVTSLVKSLIFSKGTLAKTWRILKKVLRRELGHDGFAFAVTLAVWGGLKIGSIWNDLSVSRSLKGESESSTKNSQSLLVFLNQKLSAFQRGFISYAFTSTIAFYLLQAGRQRSERLQARSSRTGNISTFPLIPYTPPTPTSTSKASPTLDLTLLLVVRALDVVVQSLIRRKCYSHPDDGVLGERKRVAAFSTGIDAFAFWACSARIMWCFFYEPQRLPQSYVRWIGALANVDKRLLNTLRYLREGTWSYVKGSQAYPTVLTTYAKDLGYPESWGDPLELPTSGLESRIWEKLGVVGRERRGGLPCELVHGGEGKMFGLEASCLANAGIRGSKAFLEALAIYLPVHIFPILITRPSSLLRPHRALLAVTGACRSATFLSTFISSYWLAVCFTRTMGLARLFPQISHEFWDGPYGCTLAGCLVCGSSIWIEKGRRRGEMALYVLPRAIRTCIPDRWVRSRNMALERFAFVISAAFLLMTAKDDGESLRGMSRWVLSFMMNGPHAGFWQRRQKALATQPGTPKE